MKYLFLVCCFVLSVNISVFANPISYENTEEIVDILPLKISIEDFEELDVIDMFDEDFNMQGFEIRSFEMKDIESTFDLVRNFSGLAQKDTEIMIKVFVLDAEEMDMLVENESYQIYVGASGIFSQSVALSLGKNYIIIYVNKGEEESIFKTLIKRKDIEIKQELEQGIVLPGQNLQHRYSQSI